MDIIGSRIKHLRKEMKLQQKDLAKAFNVSATAISYWETGYRNPDIDSILMICNYFHVSADYLLGLTDEPGGIAKWEVPEDEKLLQELAGYYEKLTDANRYRLIAEALDLIKFQNENITDREKREGTDTDKKLQIASTALRPTGTVA